MKCLKAATLAAFVAFLLSGLEYSSGADAEEERSAEVDPFSESVSSEPATIYRRPSIESLKDFELGEYEYAASLTIIPTFKTPVHIRVLLKQDGGKLFAHRWSGPGGYDSGEINLAFETHLNRASYYQFLIHLESADFWEFPEKEKEPPLIADGDGWTIEVRSKNQYLSVYRHCPDSETKERDLEEFLFLGNWLLNGGGIVPIWPISEETSDEMVAPFKAALERIRQEKSTPKGSAGVK